MLGESLDSDQGEDSEADDEEARTRTNDEEDGGEWLYDERRLQADRDEAAARADITRKQWDTISTNASRIHKHLSSQHEDYGSVGLDFPRSPSESARGEASSWLDTQKRMAYVGSQMSQSRERFTGFVKRRTLQEEGFHQSRVKLVAHMEASDQRCLGKQREMIEAQRRRAFNNAQKRSEQQKVLREVQKEKERIWEAYYERSHAKQQASPSGKKSPRSPQSSKPGCSASGDLDILRSVHQSHCRYIGQLDQWRVFVAENERRTDVQWKKVLQGGRKEDYVSEEPKTSKERFHSVLKKVTVGRAFKQAVTTRLKIEATPEVDSIAGVGAAGNVGETGSPSTWRSGGSPMFASCSGDRVGPTLSAKWSERKQMTLDFAEAVEHALKAKGQKDEDNLAQARQRIAHHNKSISDRCKESGRVWQEKCDAAASRRRNAAQADNEDYQKKLAALTRRLKEESDRRKAHAKAEGEEHARKVAKCKETSQSIEQAFIASTVEQLTKLDAAMVERESIKQAEADARRAKDKFQEHLEQARQKKADDVKASCRKARTELLVKKARSELALTNSHMSAFDRERSRRKRRKAGLSASAPVDPASPSGASDGGVVLPRLSGTMSLPILLKPVDASPIRPPPRRKSEDSSSEVDSESEDDDGGHGGKAAFLQELESNCGLWLTDLRKNRRLAFV